MENYIFFEAVLFWISKFWVYESTVSWTLHWKNRLFFEYVSIIHSLNSINFGLTTVDYVSTIYSGKYTFQVLDKVLDTIYPLMHSY